ncbi:hypothetical protein TNCV_1749831 [Trichonephila clavipes]|nr:hypothetical protein TNCV_1749831 [Trichonephila clavipes]
MRPLSGRSYIGQSGCSKNRDQKVREKISGGGVLGWREIGSNCIGRARSSVKIGIDQDISWPSNEWVCRIFRDGFDSWVVMPIYIAEEVNCDISDTLSDSWDIT